MKLKICIILLLACTVYGKTPIDYKKWQLDDTTFQKRIGGSVANYPTANAWAAIENDFEIEGDSVVYVNKSVIKTRVNKNGVSTVTVPWDGAEYTIIQKMIGIGWIKISTRQSQWIDSTMDWSNFGVDSNIGTWTGVSPGVDYRVRKLNGQVQHGIFYKPAFIDSAIVLYNQREDSLDIALANVMVYTLSSNIDNADSAIGDTAWRRLKNFGYWKFDLGKQRLHFPGSDTLPRIPVRQYWERRGTKIICIEYVMMKWIKQVHEVYPEAVIWHNDTKTIDGTTNVEDAVIWSGGPDNNYGGAVGLLVSNAGPFLVRVKNVASEIGGGATVTAAVCSIKAYGGITTTIAVPAYRVFKPWVEGDEDGVNDDDGDVTWNDWASDADEWTTEGCLCADDGGSDNSTDDGPCNASKADRMATAEDTETLTAFQSIWYAWNMSEALAAGWYTGTAAENGFKCELPEGGANFRSTEYGSGDNPFFVFTYTAGAAEIPNRRRRIIQGL